MDDLKIGKLIEFLNNISKSYNARVAKKLKSMKSKDDFYYAGKLQGSYELALQLIDEDKIRLILKGEVIRNEN